MECPNGSMITETEHQVKTIMKAREWFSQVKESDLPIKVRQFTAKGGRCMIKVSDKNGKLLHTRG